VGWSKLGFAEYEGNMDLAIFLDDSDVGDCCDGFDEGITEGMNF
jgi:hypothetical protein